MDPGLRPLSAWPWALRPGTRYRFIPCEKSWRSGVHWKHLLWGKGSVSIHSCCFFPDENSESESDSDDRFKGEVWLPTSMAAIPSPGSRK